MEEEGWSSDIVGLTREDAVTECEQNPDEFELGLGDVDVPSADDLEVSQDGPDRATVTWTESGGGPDGSSGFTYTWDLAVEDGGWRIDNLGGIGTPYGWVEHPADQLSRAAARRSSVALIV